jgi:hypothetical protein
MAFSKEQLEAMAQSIPFWWHSIDLGNGVTTNGFRSLEELTQQYRAIAHAWKQ